MRYRSGAKPRTFGQFTPKLRVGNPQIEHEMPVSEHPTSVRPVEPLDPHETGSPRAAQRKILEQNISEGDTQQHPEAVAGQHATGSFTGRKRRVG